MFLQHLAGNLYCRVYGGGIAQGPSRSALPLATESAATFRSNYHLCELCRVTYHTALFTLSVTFFLRSVRLEARSQM